MSLTVRQLLAYLDDSLEPAQAKVIGKKLAESPAAQELLDQIKRALTERPQTAPPVTGPEELLNANAVAGYLDGSLTEAQRAEVEKILSQHDLYLAEAAVCHQILSSFEAQTPSIPALARKRMYGLVKLQTEGPAKILAAKGKGPLTSRILAPFRRSLKPSPPSASPPPESEELPEAIVEDEAPDLEVPEYLRADRRRRRLVKAATVLCLFLLVSLAAWRIWPHGGLGRIPETPVALSSTRSDLEILPSPVPMTDRSVEKPPAKQTEIPLDKSPVKQPEQPPDKQPVKQPIDQPVTPRPRPERKEGIARYIGPTPGFPGVLVRRPDGDDLWQRIPQDGFVASTDRLLGLPGNRPEVRLESGVLLTLAGNLPEFSGEFPVMESAVILHLPEPGNDADLTLERGRIFLANVKPNGEAHVRVRFLGEIWDLTLKESQTTVALERWGIHPPDVPFNREGKGEGPMFFVNLFGFRGHAELKIGFRTIALPAPSIYSWNNRQGAPRGPQPLAVPRWFTEKEPPKTAKDLVIALNELNGRMTTKPVEIAIFETRKDTRPASRVAALRCQGAIDSVQDLLDTLGNEKDSSDRDFAMFTLRQWIGQNPGNEAKLYRTMLEKMKASYTPLQAEIVIELLHTFPPNVRRNPETYEKLIADLVDKKQAIRHMSYWHLIGLDPEGRSIRYDPAGDPEQLLNGMKEWKKRIPEGKLPPAPKPDPGK